MSYELRDYLNSINKTKENLMDTGDEMWEKKYPAFVINRCLSPFPDTVLLVNELNTHHQLETKMQYDFLLNALTKKNRFTPWLKKEKLSDLEIVKEYYGYSNYKAKTALSILSDEDLDNMRKSLSKGGSKK